MRCGLLLLTLRLVGIDLALQDTLCKTPFCTNVVVAQQRLTAAVLSRLLRPMATADSLAARLAPAVRNTDSKCAPVQRSIETSLVCSCGSTAAHCGVVAYGNCGYTACGNGLCCTRYG